MMNGEQCADYKVECHIKPAVYFDAKRVQSEAEKMMDLRIKINIGREGGHEEEPRGALRGLEATRGGE